MKATAKYFVIGFVAVGLVATAAFAAVLLIETFTAVDQPLDGYNSWVATSGVGNKPVQITGEKITLEQSPGSGEDLHKPFPQQDSTQTTYACFDVTVPSTFGTGGNAVVGSDIYFAGLREAPSFFFFSRTYVVGATNPGGDFTFGLSVSSGGLTQTWGTDLNFDQQYQIVISYDPVTATSKLWVDPVSEASTFITESRPADRGDEEANHFFVRQSSGGLGDQSNQIVDNITVGQSFNEVCDIPVQAETTTWGKIKGDYR